ncbi:hypothetical protein [Stackebrandtia soli]|uniref:hypothetical protein n=1 Tax=Stackebrandtia soli TaxID=1892856 RepID=UPI0039EC9909
MFKLLTALLIGVLLGGIALLVALGDPDHFWIVPVVVPFLFIGFSIAGASGRLSIRSAIPETFDIGKPIPTGPRIPARIEHIERTNAINGQPLGRLRLVVAPPDRDAYQTTATALLDIVTLSRFQPGAIIPVVRNDPDRPEVTVITTHDPQWSGETPSGVPIPSAVYAPEWKSDPKPAPRPTPPGRRGSGLRIASYIALVAVGFGIVIAPSYDRFSQGVAGILTGEDPFDYTTGRNVAEGIDALIEEVGGPMFTDISLHDGYIIIEAPTTPGAVTLDAFHYRYGVASRQGPSTIQPEDIDLELFDVREVDFTLLPDLIARTHELTGLTGEIENTYIGVRRFLGSPDDGPGPLEIDITLDDPYHDGSVTFDLSGKVSRMYGGVPGSQSYEAEHSED